MVGSSRQANSPLGNDQNLQDEIKEAKTSGQQFFTFSSNENIIPRLQFLSGRPPLEYISCKLLTMKRLWSSQLQSDCKPRELPQRIYDLVGALREIKRKPQRPLLGENPRMKAVEKALDVIPVLDTVCFSSRRCKDPVTKSKRVRKDEMRIAACILRSVSKTEATIACFVSWSYANDNEVRAIFLCGIKFSHQVMSGYSHLKTGWVYCLNERTFPTASTSDKECNQDHFLIL
ncbi:hypothetical protein SELMODRAFT_415975 [Selaginella moellendorffii]|uniref:Uncharacterized protein n=1 Tax=Selaginella moellendorffii TaxID=88036 RepID=D8RXP3_SELML|nr:hypothetical protein SELMODRAFT_415975 [Selaginella moellendorffii]